MTRKVLTKDQAMFAIQNGELENTVIASTNIVVVILTQNWCPQWHDVSSWVYDLKLGQDIDVYELVYNKVDYFNEFMRFKENTWRNHQVPYLRFYKDGKLVKETNYISETYFKKLIESL